jgi:hypothetical protein
MTPTLPVNPPPRRLSGARIATLVAAGVLAVCSIGFLAAGALLLWGDSRHDEQGYINSDRERLQTRTSALVTDNLDLDLDGADRLIGSDAFGKVRLQVEAAAGEPVFVGIAPTNRVEDYLRGAAHDVVTDVDLAPFHIAHRTRDGAARPAAPAEQRFWAASAQGGGTQTLDWDVEDGDWSVVVMNADGSPGVSAGVRAGAGLPWLAPAGWGALGGGMLLLVAAAGMTFLALRTPVR